MNNNNQSINSDSNKSGENKPHDQQQQQQNSSQPKNDAQNEPQINNEINNLNQEIASLKDKNLRLLAELDNIRRRSKEDIEKTAKYAISNFASDLVPSIENFFLASSNAPIEELEKTTNLKNYHQAIDMTHKELIKTLQKNNITRIYPINEKFNHNLHEAISRIESKEEEGIILQVIQAGYQIGERLIKPALVSVSKKAS
jgi:molecular chaperone GrpE